eukprot:g4916.t1
MWPTKLEIQQRDFSDAAAASAVSAETDEGIFEMFHGQFFDPFVTVQISDNVRTLQLAPELTDIAPECRMTDVTPEQQPWDLQQNFTLDDLDLSWLSSTKRGRHRTKDSIGKLPKASTLDFPINVIAEAPRVEKKRARQQVPARVNRLKKYRAFLQRKKNSKLAAAAKAGQQGAQATPWNFHAWLEDRHASWRAWRKILRENVRNGDGANQPASKRSRFSTYDGTSGKKGGKSSSLASSGASSKRKANSRKSTSKKARSNSVSRTSKSSKKNTAPKPAAATVAEGLVVKVDGKGWFVHINARGATHDEDKFFTYKGKTAIFGPWTSNMDASVALTHVRERIQMGSLPSIVSVDHGVFPTAVGDGKYSVEVERHQVQYILGDFPSREDAVKANLVASYGSVRPWGKPMCEKRPEMVSVRLVRGSSKKNEWFAELQVNLSATSEVPVFAIRAGPYANERSAATAMMQAVKLVQTFVASGKGETPSKSLFQEWGVGKRDDEAAGGSKWSHGDVLQMYESTIRGGKAVAELEALRKSEDKSKNGDTAESLAKPYPQREGEKKETPKYDRISPEMDTTSLNVCKSLAQMEVILRFFISNPLVEAHFPHWVKLDSILKSIVSNASGVNLGATIASVNKIFTDSLKDLNADILLDQVEWQDVCLWDHLRRHFFALVTEFAGPDESRENERRKQMEYLQGTALTATDKEQIFDMILKPFSAKSTRFSDDALKAVCESFDEIAHLVNWANRNLSTDGDKGPLQVLMSRVYAEVISIAERNRRGTRASLCWAAPIEVTWGLRHEGSQEFYPGIVIFDDSKTAELSLCNKLRFLSMDSKNQTFFKDGTADHSTHALVEFFGTPHSFRWVPKNSLKRFEGASSNPGGAVINKSVGFSKALREASQALSDVDSRLPDLKRLPFSKVF